MTGWQATLVPRHILSGRVCATSKNTASRCGCAPVRSCAVRFNASWSSKLGLFRSVLVVGHLVQPFDAVTLCVQVGMMLRRLPHSVQQNDGRRVRKYCNTLNDFILWCLFCWRASWTEYAGVVNISRCAMFGFC